MARRTIPKKVKTAIREYVSVLKADRLPIQRVILFGSYAKGKQNRLSDVDVCIISPKFKDAFSALQYLWLKRTVDTEPRVEPLGFNPKDFKDDTSLTLEIKKHGIEMKV